MKLKNQNCKNIFFKLTLLFFSVNITYLYSDWSSAVQISSGVSSVNPSGPYLSINTNSVALVGWLDGPLSVAQTLSSSQWFPKSLSWTSPEFIYSNSDPGVFPVFPVIGEDIFENQFAGFSILDSITFEGISINLSKRLPQDNAWPALISQSINSYIENGKFSIDCLGNVTSDLALTPTGASPFNITITNFSKTSSSWLPQITIAQDNSVQSTLTSSAKLNIGYYVWKTNIPSIQLQTVSYNFLTNTYSTISTIPIPASTIEILGIDIGIDSEGNMIVIYGTLFVGGTALYSTTLLSGETTWSDPLLISDPLNNIESGSIATDSSGSSTILWAERRPDTLLFFKTTTLPLGGTPSSTTTLSPLGTAIDRASEVKVDSFGNTVALWGITIGGSPSIQVSSKALGEDWLPTETLSSSGLLPAIALSDQGTAVATWVDTLTSYVMGSRNLFLFTLAPPSNFLGQIVKNEFLTESNYFLEMCWFSSLAPNIVDYKIYKNGNLIATIPANCPTKFLHLLNCKNTKETYTLIATASNGNTSAPIALEMRCKCNP